MLDVMILGFLTAGPLHGYQLRRKITDLYGHARKISEGSLYPAIGRLERSGLITRRTAPGLAGAQRQVLRLTPTGRGSLRDRLRDASGSDITDLSRYLVVLAFLSLLPDPYERSAVLRRRLEFLDQPASFFYDGDRPLKLAEIDDVYRHGMLTIARATSRAERRWLREQLEEHQGLTAAESRIND